MDSLTWAIICLCVGLALAMLEFFVPSGGIIGLLAVGTLLTAIVMAFQTSAWTGLAFAAVSVIGAPVMISLAFRWWPNTPMGRRLLLDVHRPEDVLPDNDLRRELKNLVGKFGEAKTLMTPNGAVDVHGRVVDAVSEGMVIEPGRRVRVVEVRGTRVLVRPAADEPVTADPQDPLTQPIESLGLDPFADPPA